MRTFLAALLAVLTVGYLLPTSIAVVRRIPAGNCFLVNLLLGWTVLFWVVALLMACKDRHDV